MASFALIWLGQFISLVGSGLTYFALPVLTYQRTGSATQVSLIYAFAALPSVFVSPFAGALVDRWPRRRVMILSDSVAALSTLVFAWALVTGQFEVWQIYVLAAVNSACSAFQGPAYNAAIPSLVPKEHLGRVNGMVQTAQAVRHVVAPTLAGVLLVTIRIEGIILIDLATFLFAVSTLLLVRIPPVKATTESAAGQGLLGQVSYGWVYLKSRPGLLAIVTLYTASNFTLGFVVALFTPLVLSSHLSPAVMGYVLTVGGVGMLAGSLAMSVWGGPKRRIYGLIIARLLAGGFIALGGVRQSAVLFGVAAFGFFFTLPFDSSSVRAIIQAKVSPDVQGRIFALIAMIADIVLLITYPAAGPLADYVFEPLLSVKGVLASSVGRLIGIGPGRGIGLIFVLSGLILAASAIGGYLYPRLRWVEDELPDIATDMGDTA
jgi:DHA3 family macrolide efflux protein-like MFS transporter